MSDATTDEQVGRSLFAQYGVSTSDALIAAYTFFLTVAFGPFFIFASYTPRMALLLIAFLPGLVCMVQLARQRDRAAQIALALSCWVVVASAFTGDMVTALKGTVGRESSGLIIVAAFSTWALGRMVTNRQLLIGVVLGGLALSGIVGALQIVLDIESGTLALYGSRATGLTPNPVFLGGLMAGGAAMAAAVYTASRVPAYIAAVAFFAFAANLSGSRVGLVAGLLGVIGASVALRRRGWVAPGAYLVGVALSAVFVEFGTSARAASARVVSDGGSGRGTVWVYGWEAFLEKPIFGWGFGRFRASVQRRFSSDFVRDYAADDLRQAWFDAHNIVVTVVVAVGFVGALLVAAFVVFAAQSARGPACVAHIRGGAHLVPPTGRSRDAATRHGLPGRLDAAADRTRRCCRYRSVARDPMRSAALVTAGALSLIAGLWLVVADSRLQSAVDQEDAAKIESAAAWFPRDSVVADLVAQAWFIEEELDPSLRPKVITWSNKAIEAEPDRPYFWSRKASRLMPFEDYDGVIVATDEALRLQPWQPTSLAIRFILAQRTDDAAAEAEFKSKLCALDLSSECPVTERADS